MVGFDDIDGIKTYRVYVPEIRTVVVVSPHVDFLDTKATTDWINTRRRLTKRQLVGVRSKRNNHKSSLETGRTHKRKRNKPTN